MIPQQEPGVRPARALPYRLSAQGLLQLIDGSFRIDFANTGQAAAVFQVRSGAAAHIPRTYTVEPGKSLSDNWALDSLGLVNCDLSVYGPNGFFRAFQGNVAALRSAQLVITVQYDEPNKGITLVIGNPSASTANVTILDRYAGQSIQFVVGAASSQPKSFARSLFSGWYDFVITSAANPTIRYQVAGHVETGKDSFSDPALGGLALSS